MIRGIFTIYLFLFIPFYFFTLLLLPDTHTGLDDIHNVVCQFLTFIDEIHVDGTHSVSILMVVHIRDVLRLQLVAVVVDLVLDIK